MLSSSLRQQHQEESGMDRPAARPNAANRKAQEISVSPSNKDAEELYARHQQQQENYYVSVVRPLDGVLSISRTCYRALHRSLDLVLGLHGVYPQNLLPS